MSPSSDCTYTYLEKPSTAGTTSFLLFFCANPSTGNSTSATARTVRNLIRATSSPGRHEPVALPAAAIKHTLVGLRLPDPVRVISNSIWADCLPDQFNAAPAPASLRRSPPAPAPGTHTAACAC